METSAVTAPRPSHRQPTLAIAQSTEIEVAFAHWRYEFPEEELSRYGSRYFDRKEAGKYLAESVARGASKVSDHLLRFDGKQILSANEAFPEAALADPL